MAEGASNNGLEGADIERAIRHLAKLGDSDIVPSLPEYTFFEENSEALTKVCRSLSLGSFRECEHIRRISKRFPTYSLSLDNTGIRPGLS